MPTVHRSALLFYSAADMYALVSDIESYPDFLPWCRSTRILDRKDDELEVYIEMVTGGVQKSFTTYNRLQPYETIEIHLLEGPFQRLEGLWQFQPLRDEACKVSLDMEFEFASRFLHIAIAPVFAQVANSLLDSFYKRAVEMYGRR